MTWWFNSILFDLINQVGLSNWLITTRLQKKKNRHDKMPAYKSNNHFKTIFFDRARTSA